jgi:hypothetical protein
MRTVSPLEKEERTGNMKIAVSKTQEFTKGMLGGTNLRLHVKITFALSSKEKTLIEKYPKHKFISISRADLEQYIPSTSITVVNVLTPKKSALDSGVDLKEFEFDGYVDDGYQTLGIIQKLVNAILTEAKEKMNYLKALDQWEGKYTVSTEEE